MLKATVSITCDTCGLKYESQTQPAELVVEPALMPAWTAWELIEQAKRDGWLVKDQQVFCANHTEKRQDILSRLCYT